MADDAPEAGEFPTWRGRCFLEPLCHMALQLLSFTCYPSVSSLRVSVQGSDPGEVVEKVSAQSQLDPTLHEALRQRVQEELEKRRRGKR